MKLYISARREIPSDESLTVEVQLAMVELQEIPTDRLPECFQEAKIQAGAFVATNGNIVKVWREKRRNAEVEAQKAIRDRNAETWRAGLLVYEADKPQPGFIESFFADVRKCLGISDGAWNRAGKRKKES